MDKEKVFITIKKKATIEVGKDVLIEDLATIYSPNENLMRNIGGLRVLKKRDYEDWSHIEASNIAEKVFKDFPNVDLTLLGEVESLLEFKSKEKPKNLAEFIKISAVCILVFFGASLAIINFHEDVNTKKTMQDLYRTFTGEKKDNPLLLIIPYIVGIGIGVITFFYRVISTSERRKKEPGPMEIELYLYDQDMEEHILDESKKTEE